jgi:hypothetical protein
MDTSTSEENIQHLISKREAEYENLSKAEQNQRKKEVA